MGGSPSKRSVLFAGALLMLSLELVAGAGCQSSPGKSAGGSSGGAGGYAEDAGAAGLELGTTPTTLYHLGRGGGIVAHSVEVDGQNLFWGGISLFQAPKTGGVTPSLLATSGGGIFVIRASEKAVLWLETGELKRTPKVGFEPTGVTYEDLLLSEVTVRQRRGLEPERIALPWSVAEDLLIDGNVAYVAMAGCAGVVRVNLETLATESLQLETPLAAETGYTFLAQHGSTLYCGAWKRIVRIPDFTRMEDVTTSATRVAGLGLVGSDLYWLDKLGSSSGDARGQMWKLVPGGAPANIGTLSMGIFGPSRVHVDGPKNRLFWVDLVINDYSVATNIERVWRRSDFASGGSARDETYLYWTRSAPSFATIERMRLDMP
jgi:hypothetical protein